MGGHLMPTGKREAYERRSKTPQVLEVRSKLFRLAGKRGTCCASLIGARRRSVGRDRAKPWIDQHLRCRFQHLYQFQHRAANHYQWDCFATCCLLYNGTRNTTSDNYGHNRYALSSCNRGGSRPRLGESAWSTLYISRRWRGCSRHGNYRGSAWNHPSWLLFQRWRHECNAIHDGDPQWRRRLHFQARWGA